MPETESIRLEIIQNMSRQEIEDRIDREELQKIKEADKSPVFDVFRIAHAGLSKSYIVGMGNKVLRWFNKTIKAIHNSLRIGLKAFFNHKKDSIDHKDRPEVGRLVGKYYEEDADGTANAYGILYRYPGTDLDYDMASYEGTTLVPSIDADGWDVAPEDIREIKGIALGHTRENSPAFSNAKRTLQFCIQNMVNDLEKTTEGEGKEQQPEKKQEDKAEKEEDKMDFKLEDVKVDDLKKEITRRNLMPSMIFSKKSLEDDEVVISIANEKNKNTHFVALRKDDKISELEAKLKKSEEELKNKDNEIAEAKKEAVKIIAEKKIIEVFEGRKLSEKNPALEKWARKKLKGFSPIEQDKIEAEARKYIDELIDEFNGYEKDGLLIAIKEEKEDKKPKEPEKEKDSEDKSEKNKNVPLIDASDIIDPQLAEKVAERVKAWNE